MRAPGNSAKASARRAESRINYREIGCLPPGPSDEYELDDYPRWNFLISGLKRQLLRTYTAHSFLEFDSCPGSAVTDRFIEISSPSTPASGGGNTAHFIYPDPNPALGSHEVVYALGGSVYGETCSQLVSNAVLTMTDPDPGTDWVDGGIGMNRRRIDHNSVILLDGSILVVNGYGPAIDAVPPVDCTPKRKPELFKPAEIFATATAPAWELMAPQATDRTYHSGAVLHPDGTVVSGGGLELNPLGCNQLQLPTECLSGVEGPSWHSIEVFSPPYMFQGRRPVITGFPTLPIQYGSLISISANLFGGDDTGEFRVALVAPGTATHGFDFNQRYIKLRVFQFTPGSPASIQVEAPANGRHAPPGSYMLTVVNANGVPSKAQWVQVGT